MRTPLPDVGILPLYEELVINTLLDEPRKHSCLATVVTNPATKSTTLKDNVGRKLVGGASGTDRRECKFRDYFLISAL